ncbi:MAG: ABC transporter permease subunit [Verrucomicrobiota bacterium]
MSPILTRELRGESRNNLTWHLRLTAALLLFVMFVVGVWNQEFFLSAGGKVPGIGAVLFNQMHQLLIGACIIVIPLMTFDVLSREKREGTLDLLLLTPTTVTEIVFSKALAHLLRSGTFLLACTPMMILPLVVGGVTAANVESAILRLAAAFFLASAASLLGSASGTARSESMFLALSYSFLFAILFWVLRDYFAVLSDAFNEMICAVGLFAGAIWLSGRLVRRDRGGERAFEDWAHALDQTVFKNRIRPVVRYARMTRQPIIWLLESSVRFRLIKWGVLGLFIAAIILACAAALPEDIPATYLKLVWIYLLAQCWLAAESFRRERENGMLELLLVTPIARFQFIEGMYRSLFAQLMPACLTLLIARILLPGPWQQLGLVQWTLIPSLIAVPMIGLYFSFRFRNVLFAWSATCLFGMLLPVFAGVVSVSLFRSSSLVALDFWIFVGVQCCFALLAGILVTRELEHD